MLFLLLLYRWKCYNYEKYNIPEDEISYQYYDVCIDKAPPTPTPIPTPTPMAIFRVQPERKFYGYGVIIIVLIALLIIPLYVLIGYYIWIMVNAPKDLSQPEEGNELIKIE